MAFLNSTFLNGPDEYEQGEKDIDYLVKDDSDEDWEEEYEEDGEDDDEEFWDDEDEDLD